MIANRAIALAHARPGMVPLRPAEIPVPRPARPPLYVPAGATLPPGAAHRCLRPQTQWLPVAILGLKLAASVLAGATITLAFWPNDSKPIEQQVAEEGRARLAYELARRESSAVRSVQKLSQEPFRNATTEAVERPLPQNHPRRVQTVRVAVPEQRVAHIAPTLSRVPEPMTTGALPPLGNLPIGDKRDYSALAGKQLRYLIGGSAGQGHDGEVTMVSYSTNSLVKHGISIAYCNLFEEAGRTGRYAPYLNTSDTARQYGEGQIDPHGAGWEKNLRDQYERRRKAGFEYVELDNPDAYKIKDVIGAIELAASYNLKVIAKNPGITDDPVRYVSHPNVYGIIVEKGAGGASDMEALRKKAGKPNLPVWFVAFGSGRGWAGNVANTAKNYRNMGVTYSSAGEYGNALDVLVPAS